MKKIIHCCWFGNKKLSKMARKCIKSWKKYLPDYEIIIWSEKNVDLNECLFVREAYKSKKWAFVADYARAKALYEYGGIYFDTDMKVIKNIDDLLKNSFLGVEDSGYIACGVWNEIEPKSELAKELLDFYKGAETFDPDNLDMFSISIPRLITQILKKQGFNTKNYDLQILNNGTYIYPREYFYPLSYNHQNNNFTENTCMIHYFDASWIPKTEQIANYIRRKFGPTIGQEIINFIIASKRVLKKLAKVLLFFYIIYRNKIKRKKELNKIINNLENLNQSKNYIAIYHKNWLGTMHATKELFDNTLAMTELYDSKFIKEVAKIICSKNFELIIFSAFADSWYKLIKEIRKIDKSVKIKVIWHGSDSKHMEDYDWNSFSKIFELLQDNKIESIGLVKKSQYEFYKLKGFNVEFVMNTIKLPRENRISRDLKDNNNIKIGLYASSDIWVKNCYSQLAAASLVENAIVECIPVYGRVSEFARLVDANVVGCNKTLKREGLLKKMAKNDINLYATFTECAPLLPLESLELGVPCITGNNHHYWENTELEKYLVVNECDNVIKIYEKIMLCLNNREKIIELYDQWKEKYDIEARESVKQFLKR